MKFYKDLQNYGADQVSDLLTMAMDTVGLCISVSAYMYLHVVHTLVHVVSLPPPPPPLPTTTTTTTNLYCLSGLTFLQSNVVSHQI